jgi:phosphohistidine phosphatase
MLTLSLLRHAKSSWDDLSIDDYDRGLSPRGVKAAGLMGRYLAKEKLVPDLVLCSGAVRTRATLALLLPELGEPAPAVRYDDALYLAEPEALLEAVRGAGKARHVMVIAHNPGIHALALGLLRGGNPKSLADLASHYPTAALAVITLSSKSWKEIGAAQGLLERFVTPRGLKGEG